MNKIEVHTRAKCPSTHCQDGFDSYTNKSCKACEGDRHIKEWVKIKHLIKMYMKYYFEE